MVVIADGVLSVTTGGTSTGKYPGPELILFALPLDDAVESSALNEGVLDELVLTPVPSLVLPAVLMSSLVLLAEPKSPVMFWLLLSPP